MRNGLFILESGLGLTAPGKAIVLAALALLAILTYLPFIHLPALQDDYLQRNLAERYGAPSGWGQLLHDPLYRCRATSILMTAATIHLFGPSVPVMNASTIAVHAVNVILIGLLGCCRWIGWPLSLAAAFVFAVGERHHEAVVWYASLHEPLVLLFILIAMLSLIRALEGGSRLWWAGVTMGWVLALASKESGVVLAALLPALAALYGRWKLAAALAAIGLAAAAGYFLLAQGQQHEHQHFNDGTFSLKARFLTTLLNSAARGLWIWGGLSLMLIALWRRKAHWKPLALAAVWFVCGLLPYSFLTYMPRIPSRHHYIAAAGASLLIAAAFWLVMESSRHPRRLAAVLASAFLAHNWFYLWNSKKPQFEWRAAIIEQFVDFAARHPGARLANGCPELNLDEARKALHYRLGLDLDQVLLAGDHSAAPVYNCPPAPKR